MWHLRQRKLFEETLTLVSVEPGGQELTHEPSKARAACILSRPVPVRLVKRGDSMSQQQTRNYLNNKQQQNGTGAKATRVQLEEYAGVNLHLE